MKKTGIMTDSHSGISQAEATRLGITVLPMPFYINEECFYEEINLTQEQFFQKMKENVKVSTSQPSPDTLIQAWNQMLEEYEEVLYIPISSGLSGSCSSAAALAGDETFAGRVYVVDNGRVATPLHRSVLDAIELVEQGYGAEQIREALERDREMAVVYVAVDTLEYLKRGGRISSSAAMMGGLLNIKPVLKVETGLPEPVQKCRGFVKARHAMIDAIRKELEGRFAEAYAANEIHLMAASSADQKTTEAWVQEIEAAFPGMPVLCDPLALAIACHIGPGGLGIACSVKPHVQGESSEKLA